MEPVAIIEQIRARFPEEVIDSYLNQGQGAVIVRAGRIKEMVSYLRDDPSLQMNHLRALCGVDNSRRKDPALSKFEVVYNLYSIALGHEIRLRAEVGDTDPAIDSVVELWPGADWLERETYDLMGSALPVIPICGVYSCPRTGRGIPCKKVIPLKGRWNGRG